MISSSLATSCGIGGGTVYSSMILGVEELEPSQAFPISNFLILFCGLVTFVSFTMDKFAHPKNKFINYLPKENSGRLKMDLLYDQNGLIDLILNNEISYIDDNSIYKDLAKWPNISAVC